MSLPADAPRLPQEMRRTGVLAAPLVLGHLSTGLIGFVDSVIAGHHGTDTWPRWRLVRRCSGCR